MCSSVHHRVVWCQVRAIDTFIVRIEGKLKNLHSWEASAFTKLNDFIRHKAKVLSDDVQITELFLHGCKEFVARTFDPFTRCCSFRTSWDFPVWFETTEVVDPNDVIDLEAFTQAFNPPLVAIFVHCFPVIDWVPPKLTSCWELIWRASCNASCLPVFICFEEMRISPHVAWIFCYIDWHISHNFNVVVVGISFQGQPLLEEEELSHTMVSQFIRQFFTVFSQSFWLTRTNICIWPFCPSFQIKVFFNSHVFCEELQPRSIGFTKFLEFFLITWF